MRENLGCDSLPRFGPLPIGHKLTSSQYQGCTRWMSSVPSAGFLGFWLVLCCSGVIESGAAVELYIFVRLTSSLFCVSSSDGFSYDLRGPPLVYLLLSLQTHIIIYSFVPFEHGSYSVASYDRSSGFPLLKGTTVP